MCCPCLMGRDGCRGTKNLNVWKRISRRAAVITCAVDILMFLLSVIVNGGFQPMWGRNDPNPLLGPSAPTLITLGAKHLVLIQEGQIWRLVTPILLHGGVLHIIMNLTSQFRMGTFLEERWGTKNWLIIYWVGGLGGNLLSCVASPDKVGVGASGAIYAIMGGWLSHITCTWGEEDEFDKFGQAVQAVFFTALGMVLSIAPIVDCLHVGTGAHHGGSGLHDFLRDAVPHPGAWSNAPAPLSKNPPSQDWLSTRVLHHVQPLVLFHFDVVSMLLELDIGPYGGQKLSVYISRPSLYIK
ncbi:unnamed protein product [Sphacelaria rigidula]